MLVVDAVILMGGRATRMGGAAKGDLRVDGRTLLERVVTAAEVARDRVVVGESGESMLPPDVRVVREQPPFGGPAAAVAAGVHELAPGGDAVLLLAGDLPFVAVAIPLLLAALPEDGDGARAVDADGRPQHLTCVVRRTALDAAIAAAGQLDGVSMRRLLEPLRMVDVEVPPTATMDVDTWADANAVGATGGGTMSVSDEEFDRMLADWADRVRAELGIVDAPLDIQQVLGVAGVAAHAIMRPAAPITTYLAGYAAGLAAAAGADAEVAARDALDRVRRLAAP